MLTLSSILQSVCQFIRAFAMSTIHVSKRMYRSMAVITMSTVVVAVLTFTSSGFAGGGRNALTAYAETPSEDLSEISEDVDGEQDVAEETAFVTEAKFQIRTENLGYLKEGQLLVGDTLAKNVTDSRQVRKERREEIQKAKEEIRQISEERERIAAEEAARKAEEERIRKEEEARRASAVVSYSDQDYEVLKRIVQAEAGGCDMKGRILVANVVINRVKSRSFPNTITGVVYEKSQFSPVSNGSINTCKVSSETVEAVNRALAGEDYSQGALYFMNRKRSKSSNVSWFDSRLSYLFYYEGHEFFK